jgi:hypothetical protein
MSFELTHGDLVLLGITLVLVVLPSRLSAIGSFLARLSRRPEN